MSHRKEHRMNAHEKRKYNAKRSNNRKEKLTIPAMLTKRCPDCLAHFQRAPKDKTPHDCYRERIVA